MLDEMLSPACAQERRWVVFFMHTGTWRRGIVDFFPMVSGEFIVWGIVNFSISTLAMQRED